MSKQYNLSTTEDNGQSVTTSETVTEHPEEILRLMKLAGLENAQVVAEDDSEFEPTEANGKLDLDDYSKKSPESIAKQKKTIQPTLGDNPLEYSLDETEIQEALTKEFDKPEEVKEEKLDEILPLIPAAVKGVKAVAKTIANKTEPATAGKTAQVKLAGHDDIKTVTPSGAVTVDFSPSSKAAGQNDPSTSYKKHAKVGRNHNDDAIAPPKGHHSNTATRWAESTEEVTEELTAGQKKLPDALQKSILAKQGKKDETKDKEDDSVEENLKEAELQIKALKEDCSCGHGSSCDCGPDCGCGCNAVNEDEKFDESLPPVDRPHVNGSQETEEIEQIIRAYWDELPEQLALDLGMHFDSLKGEFDEAQDLGQSQERIKKLMNY